MQIRVISYIMYLCFSFSSVEGWQGGGGINSIIAAEVQSIFFVITNERQSRNFFPNYRM